MKAQIYNGRISDSKDNFPIDSSIGILAFAMNLALGLRRIFGFKKMFSEIQFKYKFKKVLYITIYWVIFRIAQDCYDLMVLSNYPIVDVNSHYLLLMMTNVLATFLGGIIGGSIIIFYIEKIWRTKSLGYAMTVMSIFFTLVIFPVVAISEMVYQMGVQDLPFYHHAVLEDALRYFLSPDFRKNYLIWWLISIATIVILQVNDKYGPGVLMDLIFGIYHKPKSEERIFMFLDLRSSTSTAEQLGEEAYFNYIHDFFIDTTDAILETKGEIYQYVGDEVIVSWKMKNGIEKANPLRCFFSIKKAIENKKDYYLNEYNHIPGFKAGIHSGKVTTGEIGIVKKDITFTGDVLNTTSRIQNKCNEFGLDLLISNELLRMLPLGKSMISENIGEISLRGKESKVSLSTVKMLEGNLI